MFKYIALLALFVAVASSTSIGNASSGYSVEMTFEKLDDWKAMNAIFKGKDGYKVHTVMVHPTIVATVYVRGQAMRDVVSYVNTHNIKHRIQVLPAIPKRV